MAVRERLDARFDSKGCKLFKMQQALPCLDAQELGVA